jgi:trehalose/maltose hydrolase-like predicted phosphorylase
MRRRTLAGAVIAAEVDRDEIQQFLTELERAGVAATTIPPGSDDSYQPAEQYGAALLELGTDPSQSLLLVDTPKALRSGGAAFGVTIGYDHGGCAHDLLRAGADAVVASLSDLPYSLLEDWSVNGIEDEEWTLRFCGFDPENERLREALTTVGNGFFGTRGALFSERIQDDTHNPGTYIHNLFDRAGTEVEGKTIFNNDFVNCPNWTLTEISTGSGAWLSPGSCEVVSYEHELDMRSGIMRRRVSYREENGRVTTVTAERFASMSDPHLAALRITVEPQNHSEPITVRALIDGDVRNYLVERYRDLEQRHIAVSEVTCENGSARLKAHTRDSKRSLTVEAHTRVYRADRSVVSRDSSTTETAAVETFQSEPGAAPVTLEKLVFIGTDTDPVPASRVDRAPHSESGTTFEKEKRAHTRAWRALWDKADIAIDGDRFASRILRLHTYHLLATASPHNTELDAGLPARGLHGEAYRGHIFWDELFILPFYARRFPEIARSHLMYRYRRLEEARRLATKNGFRGAMYPWQSAYSGGPESQEIHYNPESGEWDPDLSSLQRHIGISIAYDILIYNRITGDDEFLSQYGLEMLIELARFFSSLSTYEIDDDRYHIEGVMGPDEFHEKYPQASLDEGGFRDNCYTNFMTAWLLDSTNELLNSLGKVEQNEIRERLNLQEIEVEEWRAITTRMKIPFAHDLVLSQFDGYMDLQELDWDRYEQEYGNIRRLDRILKAEGDSPDRYKVSKQADVLMIFYLLDGEEVSRLLQLMGYGDIDAQQLLEQNFAYYEPRTSHGSTLSWIVHAAILSKLEGYRSQQLTFFQKCLESDVFDSQGGTTLEGIHCGVMAGSIDIITGRLCGLRSTPGRIELSPELPATWGSVTFVVENQGVDLRLTVTPSPTSATVVHVSRLTADGPPVTVHYNGIEETFTSTGARELTLR